MRGFVVGIGELLWDVYPDGRRIAGGAPFNFAYHCHNLGHEAVIVSAVGADELGEELRAKVREWGLRDEFIQTDPHHPTGTVRVSVNAAGQPSYEIIEGVAWDHLVGTPALQDLAAKCEAVCFGTLGQRAAESGTTIAQFLSACRVGKASAHRVFDVNLRQHFYSVELLKWSLHRSHTVKLNADELAMLTDLLPLSGQTEAEQVRSLFALTAAETRVVIVTDGERGGRVYLERGDVLTEPGVPVQVADTVGAGDAFTAAMVCLKLEGKPWNESLMFAIRYAAKVCEYSGGTPRIARHEVERDL